MSIQSAILFGMFAIYAHSCLVFAQQGNSPPRFALDRATNSIRPIRWYGTEGVVDQKLIAMIPGYENHGLVSIANWFGESVSLSELTDTQGESSNPELARRYMGLRPVEGKLSTPVGEFRTGGYFFRSAEALSQLCVAKRVFQNLHSEGVIEAKCTNINGTALGRPIEENGHRLDGHVSAVDGDATETVVLVMNDMISGADSNCSGRADGLMSTPPSKALVLPSWAKPGIKLDCLVNGMILVSKNVQRLGAATRQNYDVPVIEIREK